MKPNKNLVKFLAKRRDFDKRLGQPIGSSRAYVQLLGYDRAKRMGVLEEYQDALGPNMNRPATAWQEKWSEIYK